MPYLHFHRSFVNALRHSMKKTLLITVLLLSLALNACECSEPPEIGPVEGQDNAHLVEAPAEMPALA